MDEKSAYGDEGQEQQEDEAAGAAADAEDLDFKPEWHDNPLYHAPGEGDDIKYDAQGNPIFPTGEGADDEGDLQWHDNPLYQPPSEEGEAEEGEQEAKY